MTKIEARAIENARNTMVRAQKELRRLREQRNHPHLQRLLLYQITKCMSSLTGGLFLLLYNI